MFAIYDSGSGEILRLVECPQGEIEMQMEPGEQYALLDEDRDADVVGEPQEYRYSRGQFVRVAD